MTSKNKSMGEMQRKYWDGLSDRYQRIMKISLEDFHYGPQIPGEKDLHLLPVLKAGMKALELGCGAGQNSIWLAKQGLECSAFDISEEQLRHARALARGNGVKIAFSRGSFEKWPSRFKGPYDFVHSSHAFEFADDPADAIRHIASVLAPRGWLMISTVHPLYNGDWVESYDEDGTVDGMGLFLRNYFTPPDDIRLKHGKVDVISRAYPVSAWFDWLRLAGFEVVRLAEPPAFPKGEGDPPYTNKDWADTEGELQAIPGTLIILARKKAKSDAV